MTDDCYHPDLLHLSSKHPAGIETFHREASQSPVGLEEDQIKHAEQEFKDYFCPFCGDRLFRGKVRDYKMVCHKCNRLVDSKKLEEQ